MDGFIGLSSRRSNRYNANLGIQKIGMLLRPDQIPIPNAATLQVVGYYECSVNGATVLSSTGLTSPPMYLKAGDVVYIIGCEGYIGSTTGSTAATTLTNQGRGSAWQPYISNVRTGSQTVASYQEAAILNARQNQWSPSNFAAGDWASVVTGQTAVLGTYRSFLALKIIQVTETGMYTVNTQYGPRGTGTSTRHVYSIAFRGVDTARLTTAYYEPVAGKTQFVKSTRSRISTGEYLVGLTNAGPPAQIDGWRNNNIFNIDIPGRTTAQQQADRFISIGMVPELDLLSDSVNYCKTDSRYANSWIGGLWSDQYDGAGGFSSMCGLDNTLYPTFSQTYNRSGGLTLTPSLVVSTSYDIIVPSL